MFEGAKELIDEYFDKLKEITGEEVGIMYGVYDDTDVLESDLFVGDESEKVWGIRLLNLEEEIVFDLIKMDDSEAEKIQNLSKKEKKKKLGKKVLSFEYTSEGFPIEHEFIFYSKDGKMDEHVDYAEMIPKKGGKTDQYYAFQLNEDLFEMQVQI